MAEFVKVGKLRRFPAGRGRAFDVGGVRVAVFRTEDGWIGVTDACPHMGASLADGRLVDGCIECAWHHWRYDLRSGVSDQRDWARVELYDVRVEGDEVWIRPPEPTASEEAAAENAGEDDDWIAWDPERFFRKKSR